MVAPRLHSHQFPRATPSHKKSSCFPAYIFLLAIASLALYLYTTSDESTVHGGILAASAGDDRKSTQRKLVKPQLIMHVGPPKTATTWLQTELTSFRESLQEDGFSYLGRFYEACDKENQEHEGLCRDTTELLKVCRTLFKGKLCKDADRSKCVAPFLEYIRPYQDSNVIISDENFAQWEPQDIQAFHKAIEHDGSWDVSVVVTYRHWSEWLLSAKFQRERIDKWSAFKSNWVGPGLQGSDPDPLFPTYLHKWKDLHVYCDTLVDRYGKYFPVSILNLHDKESLRTGFLCRTLTGAKTSCRRSRQQETKGETFLNVKEDVPSVFYDAIATAAASKGLVHTEMVERRFVLCEFWKENEKKREKSFKDLPLLCPSKKALNEYLKESLLLQEKMIPGSDDTEHRAEFNRRVENKDFCWVDANRVLDSNEWSSFLPRFQDEKFLSGLRYGWRCENEAES